MNVTKRNVLLALAALGANIALPASAAVNTIDFRAGRAIGEAYLAASPGLDIATLRAELLPNGFNDAAMVNLRARVTADFRAARVFIFKGWRLSETEARLFALLT